MSAVLSPHVPIWAERQPALARSLPPLVPGLRPEDSAITQPGSWLAGLSEPLRRAILARARVHPAGAGEVLSHRGDAAENWYGVVRGAIRLGTPLRDGRPYTLAFVEPGQWFGDIALIDGRPQGLDVVVHVRSVLMRVSRQDLALLLDQHGELRDAFMHLNCQRLRHMFKLLEELHALPLRQRLARQLLRLLRQFGRPVQGGTWIALRLSQSDLAAMVASSRQRVNAELGRLQDDGVVSLAETRITVVSERALREVAYDPHELMAMSRAG